MSSKGVSSSHECSLPHILSSISSEVVSLSVVINHGILGLVQQGSSSVHRGYRAINRELVIAWLRRIIFLEYLRTIIAINIILYFTVN